MAVESGCETLSVPARAGRNGAVQQEWKSDKFWSSAGHPTARAKQRWNHLEGGETDQKFVL